MCWYALFVKTGYEDYIGLFLKKSMAKYTEYVSFRVLIPKRKLIEYSGGVQREVFRVMFPGYVLVETEQIKFIVNTLKRNSNFYRLLENGDLLSSIIQADEMCQILYLLDGNDVIDLSKVFVEKEKVRVISGPLMNYAGTIRKIDKRRNRAKVAFLFNGVERTIDLGIVVLGKLLGNEMENVFEGSIKYD